jgi:hypothetical protein
MPIPAADGLSSFDVVNANHVDLSDVLSSVLLSDAFLLGLVPFGGMATQTQHYWPEDQLNNNYVTQDAADAAANPLDLLGADTDIVLASAAEARLVRIGTLLKSTRIGAQEILQVTAIAGTTLTVTRAYGSSVLELHAAPFVYRIVGKPAQENSKDVADLSRDRTVENNICEIFKTEVELSNTAMAINQAGVPNELQHQLTYRTLEIKRELAISLYHSVKSASAGSDSALRTMGGIREFLSQVGGNVVPRTGAPSALDAARVNALFRLAWNKGAEPSVGVGPADQILKFATMNQDFVRYAPSDRMRGLFVERFLTNLGHEIELHIDRWMQDGEFMIIDPKRMKLMPLKGRNWQLQPLAKVGDGQRALMVGEFTLEVRNAKEAHAIDLDLSA